MVLGCWDLCSNNETFDTHTAYCQNYLVFTSPLHLSYIHRQIPMIIYDMFERHAGGLTLDMR